mgnify:CR=1 FL=1
MLDQDLIGPLGLMVSHREFLIEKLNVDKVYKLGAGSLDMQSEHVVYITRAKFVLVC